uniref:Dickkopf N-terminal cysteine-rich domain-containing protein n=1 Tax=Salarias fasciatus TaxID=181472 RepID=A0A672H4G5_SALFA
MLAVPQAACDQDRACGRGFSCDRHFGLCVPLRGEGQYCRRDAQCVRGLSCMFGKCHRSIPNGHEGARCKLDRDCGPSMCCARHHGELVCKRRLVRGDGCYVPDGGLAFSINQICPCDEGLLCRENSAGPAKRPTFDTSLNSKAIYSVNVSIKKCTYFKNHCHYSSFTAMLFFRVSSHKF